MIPQANIVAWRSQAPWVTDSQVEQDLILSRALIEIFSDPFLHNELAFRGGTALHKLFLENPMRYSEDIDLVQINSGGVGKILEKLRSKLDPWLGKPRWSRSDITTTLVYRFISEILPITPMRLKVEINTREHFSVLGFEKRKFEVVNPWFAGNADINTFLVEEILGTKLRALYQRKKGRDLFDLDCAMNSFKTMDVHKIIKCVDKYTSFVGAKVTKTDFEKNLLMKLENKPFTNDIISLLPAQSSYDVKKAGDEVLKRIISKI